MAALTKPRHDHHHRTRGARLSRGLLLLAAAAVAVAALGATAAHAAATVTGGHCGPAGSNPWAAGSCVSGSTLRLAGTGLDSAMTVAIGTSDQQPAITCPTPTVNDEKTVLTCTVTYTGSVADGEYPVTVTLSGTQTSAGSVMIGTFLQQSIPTWNARASPAQQYVVKNVSSTVAKPWESLLLRGSFDPKATYEVLFYNTEADFVAGNDGKTPVCTVTQVAADALTCKVAVDAGVMGAWRFLVRDTATGAILPGSTALPPITAHPKLFEGVTATGDCARDSSKCVTGAKLTLVGAGFNPRGPSFNTVVIGTTTGAAQALTCAVTAVTATQLTCELTVGKGVAAGEYFVYPQVRLSKTTFSSPFRVGTLVITSPPDSRVAGWKNLFHVSTTSRVAGVSSTRPITGDTWFVFGTFDTTATYSVFFDNTEDEHTEGNGDGRPVCAVTKVESFALSCTITIAKGVMGLWDVGVIDKTHNAVLDGPAELPPIAVTPVLPSVTAAIGDCDKNATTTCVSGANLTLVGSNYNFRGPSANRISFGDDAATNDAIQCPIATARRALMSCHLTIRDGTRAGPYPVYMQVQLSSAVFSAKVWVGDLVVAPGATGMAARWVRKPREPEPFFVAGLSGARPSTGDAWVLYGRFNTTAAYRVLFFNTEKDLVEGNGGRTPVCETVTVEQYALTCALAVESGVMGKWAFLVREVESGAFVSLSSAVTSIAVTPPLPTVTGASGACAQDSSKCVTGAELTLTGSNFNAQGPSYNKVTVGSAGSGSSCAVTKVGASSLTCTLSIKGGEARQALQLAVQVQVGTADMLSPPQLSGTLVLGGGAGWVNVNQKDGGSGEVTVVVSGGSASRIVWMVLTIVFAATSAVLVCGVLALWLRGRAARSDRKAAASDAAETGSSHGDLGDKMRAPDVYGIDYSQQNSASNRKVGSVPATE